MREVVADHLTGPILQVPPMVSALRVDGRRLHELAREGVEVEREARPVTVYRFDVESTGDPLVYRIEVECSSGTYIRSLAADLGHVARRRRPPPAAAAHGHRVVHGGRRGTARRGPAAAAG